MRAPDKPTIRRSPGRPSGSRTGAGKRIRRLLKSPDWLAAHYADWFVEKGISHKEAITRGIEYWLRMPVSRWCSNIPPPKWEAVWRLLRNRNDRLRLPPRPVEGEKPWKGNAMAAWDPEEQEWKVIAVYRRTEGVRECDKVELAPAPANKSGDRSPTDSI